MRREGQSHGGITATLKVEGGFVTKTRAYPGRALKLLKSHTDPCDELEGTKANATSVLLTSHDSSYS